MPEESTFRKCACPKLKLSRRLLDNLFRILVQNLPALEELNSEKRTLYCGIAQKRNRAIWREMTFANDCANCCVFAQNWCAKKEKFCVSFRKNFAKVLLMETLQILYCSRYLIFTGLLLTSIWGPLTEIEPANNLKLYQTV